MHERDLNLYCQDCGEVIRELTPAEAQKVAADPYAFWVFCGRCGKYREDDMKMAMALAFYEPRS